jgi:hypothetical protein
MRIALCLPTISLLLTACSGPLVSQPYIASSTADKYEGTAHGLYCLPKQFFTLTVKDTPQDDSTKPENLTIELNAETAPDLDQLYRLGLSESWLSNDVIGVTYVGKSEEGQSEEGQNETAAQPSCLLASITSDVTDMTPAIAKKLVQTIFSATTGKAPTTTGGEASKGKIKYLKKVFELSPRQQDLRDAESGVNEALRAAGFLLRVKFEAEGPYLSTAANAAEPGEIAGKHWGVFGRVALPYRISIFGPTLGTEAAGADRPLKRLIEQRIVYSHNGVPPLFVQIDRAAFVQRKTTITFAGGYPTKVETDKKSELQAFANIPLDIVTAVVGAPLATIESETALAKKQSDLIDQQQKVIAAQKELAAKRQPPADQQHDGNPGAP